ncbi:Decaprenyl diphosphate synthase-like protein [Dichotomocladium elegans]|nr:Decaprenyl diphosphate synthase-like protein [Dichotomocladium elegans]
MTTTATTIATSTAAVALATIDTASPSEKQSAHSFIAQPPTLQLITSLPPPEDLPTRATNEDGPRCKTVLSKCVDILCHLLLYVIYSIYLTYIGFRTLRSLGYSRLLQYTDLDERINTIRRDKAQLTKIPKHLSILISRELEDRDLEDWELIVNDICLTSCWAWAFGIEELSVFDGSGTLKEMIIDVYKRQSTMMHQWMKSPSSSADGARPGIKFTILSTADGRASLAKTTRDIAKHAIAEGKAVDIALVDRFVHESSTSDPDLMLVYSGLPHNYISLDGFPPWHIRLTEFVNINEFHRLDYALFAQCLYKYSKVEQRYGR